MKTAARRSASSSDCSRPSLQPPQVVARREQAVDVIDAQAGRRASPNQLEDEPMHLVEHRRIFHAQRRELVHVEEAPVVDFLGRDAPVREPVRLLVEQRVERVEAARLSGNAVEAHDARASISARSGGARVGQRRQAPLDDFLLAGAHGDRLGIARAARRQVLGAR